MVKNRCCLCLFCALFSLNVLFTHTSSLRASLIVLSLVVSHIIWCFLLFYAYLSMCQTWGARGCISFWRKGAVSVACTCHCEERLATIFLLQLSVFWRRLCRWAYSRVYGLPLWMRALFWSENEWTMRGITSVETTLMNPKPELLLVPFSLWRYK